MSARNAYIVMAVLGIAIVAFVGWAMMQSFNAPVTTFIAPKSTSSSPPVAEHHQDPAHAAVPRISVADLKQKMDRGEVMLIDVREADAYRYEHIAGAVHIPLASIEAAAPSLAKDKPLVTYCT